MALAVHELATNAVKYGALQAPERPNIRWATRPGSLLFEWCETGMDASDVPLGRGFGRELIEFALPFVLGARSHLPFSETGVYCCIDLPDGEWKLGPFLGA